MKREELIAPELYNLVQEIEQYAAHPQKLAVVWMNDAGEKKTATYEQLISGANKIGNAFINSGLKQGDKVLVMMPRLIESYMVYIGAIKAGLVVIPSSEMLRKKDIEYRIHHGEVAAIVSYAPYISQFDGIDALASLHTFVIGETTPHGWVNVLEKLRTESDVLEIAPTKRDDTVFLV